MTRVIALAMVIAFVTAPAASAQRRRSPAKTPAPKPATLKTITPDVRCPSLIGMGIKTIRSFCDIPAGRDPAEGMVITLPAHNGPATLSFDLHARHTYSEEQTRSGRGYSRYRAVIGVLTPQGEVIQRAAVEAEFRTAEDLFDRIAGGAGPGGLKAVAPAGREQIFVTIPAGVIEVSLLGETLDQLTPAGHETVVMAGRPVAIVSNVLVEYSPTRVTRR